MKKLIIIFSILSASVYLGGCCRNCIAPMKAQLLVWSDSAKRATISYYDEGSKTETVSLPFYKFVLMDHGAPSSDKFYLKICDTSANFYGIIGNFGIGDSCSAMDVMQHNIFSPNDTVSTNISKSCWKISNDSLLNYAKKIGFPGYLEIKKGSTGGCQTATSN